MFKCFYFGIDIIRVFAAIGLLVHGCSCLFLSMMRLDIKSQDKMYLSQYMYLLIKAMKNILNKHVDRMMRAYATSCPVSFNVFHRG